MVGGHLHILHLGEGTTTPIPKLFVALWPYHYISIHAMVATRVALIASSLFFIFYIRNYRITPSFVLRDSRRLGGARHTDSISITPRITRSSYRELCEDCRLKPNNTGRPVTCLDRVTYLTDRHRVSEQDARKLVMQQNAENCAMTRYAVDLPNVTEGNDAGFDSMFTRPFTGDATASASVASSSSLLQGHNISIYFYETIPRDLGFDAEQKMRTRYAFVNYTEQNFKVDLAVIDLFRKYPGRIYDPKSAELFVVPFPHASHCASLPDWWNECNHVPPDTFKRVFDALPYYKGNEKRHLFVFGHESFHTHKLMRDVPLSLTLGPQAHRGYQIVIPYLNDQSSFQPSIIQQRNEEWYTRQRKYALTYFFGSVNKRMKGKSPRRYRQYFLEEVQRNWNSTADLGGLPYIIESVKSYNPLFFSNVYSESVFCPVLPGDSPSQKRFFDVILMGCLPVVLSFKSGHNMRSYHYPEGFAIHDSYPWAKGSNSITEQNEIDYQSFVVEVSGGVGNIKPAIEALMRNPSEVRQRQINLMKYASYFSYGMGKDSYKYPDAFSRIIESLRFYLANMRDRKNMDK